MRLKALACVAGGAACVALAASIILAPDTSPPAARGAAWVTTPASTTTTTDATPVAIGSDGPSLEAITAYVDAHPAPTTTLPPATALVAPLATHSAPLAPEPAPEPTTEPEASPEPEVTPEPTTIEAPAHDGMGPDYLHPFLVCTRRWESDRGPWPHINGYRVGTTFRGAYQFHQATWNDTAAKAGRPDLIGVDPAQANPADQDAMALNLYSREGNRPWNGRC